MTVYGKFLRNVRWTVTILTRLEEKMEEKMRPNDVLRLSVLVLIGFLAVPALFGTDYTYTKITDDAPGSTLGAFTSFLGPFLINSSGAVAFTAKSGNVGEVGIYTGSSSGINTVYVGGLNFSSPLVFAATGFNDSGTVVYLTEARAVYAATAGGTPFLVSTSNPTGGSGIFPGINNAGTVAYGGESVDDQHPDAYRHGRSSNVGEQYGAARIERASRSNADRPLD